MESNLLGATPLHLLAGSVSRHSYTMAELFLARGSNPNIQNSDGLTPVHIAAAWGQYEMLKLLLLHGGNPKLLDSEDKSALDLALSEGHDQCAALLRWWLRDESPPSTPVKQYSPRFFKSPLLERNHYQRATKHSPDRVSDDISIVSEDLSRKLRFAEFSAEKNKVRDARDEQTDSPRSCTVTPTEKGDPPTPFVDDSALKRATRRLLVDSCCSPCLPQEPSPPYVGNMNNLPSLCRQLNETFGGGEESKFMSCLQDTVVAVEQEKENELDSSQLLSCLKLSDNTLRLRLLDRGVDVGPITLTNRWLYARKLARLMHDDEETFTLNNTPLKKYPMDLRAAMEGRWSPTKCEMDEREMIDIFESDDRNWREGRVKTSFCYLLIDPRLAKEASNKSLSMNERFCHFIESIFYVGKGKKTRPFKHLIDAARAERQYPELACVKTKRILELWQLSAGVLSLHLFLNIMPVEAYTREAAMIEAIGVANLTNVKRGEFYGAAASWSSATRSRFGILCLQKAFEQFQVDGKRPLFPRDVM